MFIEPIATRVSSGH